MRTDLPARAGGICREVAIAVGVALGLTGIVAAAVLLGSVAIVWLAGYVWLWWAIPVVAGVGITGMAVAAVELIEWAAGRLVSS